MISISLRVNKTAKRDDRGGERPIRKMMRTYLGTREGMGVEISAKRVGFLRSHRRGDKRSVIARRSLL